MVVKRTDYYWQKEINGERHYTENLNWLVTRVSQIRLLEVFPVRPPRDATKLLVYLEGNIFFHAKFDTYEEAKRFITQPVFNQSNKEIHST